MCGTQFDDNNCNNNNNNNNINNNNNHDNNNFPKPCGIQCFVNTIQMRLYATFH